MNDDLEMGETIRGYAPGQLIADRFKLQSMIGRGGMGVVWRALDQQLDRDVALKFLPEAVSLDPRNVQEMKRETRRALELTHPYIVRIYDFVQTEGSIAISMEYVAGKSLSDLATEQPSNVFETEGALTRWTTQLCDALIYAHERAGIIHRDLKPANLMTDAGGDLRVADFGISASVTESVSRVSVSSLTSGTPLYMSPQQMMGERPSPADDIYALGATLYELLTGRPPFYTGNIILQAQTKNPTGMAIRREELEIQGAEIPAHWESTILKCLAKEPGDRPESVAEVAELLQLSLSPKSSRRSQRSQPAESDDTATRVINPALASAAAAANTAPELSPAKTSRGMTRVLVTLVSLAVVGAGGWFGWQYWNQRAPADADVASRTAEPAKNTATPGQTTTPEQASTQAQNLSMITNAVPGGAAAAAESTLAADADGQVVISLPNEAAMTFLPVAAQAFRQGSPSHELGRKNGEELRDVVLDTPYWLGQTEVTQSQYQAIMSRNPSRNRFNGQDRPVEQVTFSDITGPNGFLVLLNRHLQDSGQGEWEAVLPSEAEWEFACRAGTTTALNNGSNLTSTIRDDAANQVAVYQTVNSEAVRSKTPNSWGFYDMHGNVSEWTSDGVLRGGNYRDNAEFIRSASRLRGYQNHRQPDPRFGFRLSLRRR